MFELAEKAVCLDGLVLMPWPLHWVLIGPEKEKDVTRANAGFEDRGDWLDSKQQSQAASGSRASCLMSGDSLQ